VKTIAVLLFERVNALDVTGPLEAFASARSGDGTPLYAAGSISLDGRTVTSESGVRLVADGVARDRDVQRTDLLIVPGGSGIREPARLSKAARWLQRHHRRFRRIAAVCTGTYALAESGLLNDKKAVTHWRFAQDLARDYPRVAVEGDALFVKDGKYYSSGGITAGIDLAMALIEEDYGSRVAMSVARELVVFLRRGGGQAQFSEPLRFQTTASRRLSDVCAWAAANLSGDLSVDELARRANLSTRQFSRLFKTTFGLPPARYVARLRLDAARVALTQPNAMVQQVARLTGFESVEGFRRAFEKRFGIGPSQYQRRFGPERVVR
jgi:transcriptional regulator GlxA family with amidase domain